MGAQKQVSCPQFMISATMATFIFLNFFLRKHFAAGRHFAHGTSPTETKSKMGSEEVAEGSPDRVW